MYPQLGVLGLRDGPGLGQSAAIAFSLASESSSARTLPSEPVLVRLDDEERRAFASLFNGASPAASVAQP